MSRTTRLSQPPVLWVAARWITLLITLGLIASFWIVPEHALSVLWYALIPVLPATFLLNVEVWRNVCPLATLNTLTGGGSGSRKLARDGARMAGVVGIVLLAAMVPARRFLFNVDASVLGMAVVAVCLLAIVGGLFFEMKAGFCSSICPVLPVERLYGQRPLLTMPNARCTPCTSCSKLCLDLMPKRSADFLAMGREGERPWTMTAYGAFAVAFPGFVIAYYTLVDTTLAGAGTVYGMTAAWSVASWIVLTALFRVGRVSRSAGLVWSAALAVGLYYWFAPPGIAQEFGLPEPFIWTMRGTMLALAGAWLVRGLRPVARNGARHASRGTAPRKEAVS